MLHAKLLADNNQLVIVFIDLRYDDMKQLTLALLAAAALTNAMAQAPTAPAGAAPAAAPAAAPELAKPACTKPELPDGSGKISEARMKVFVAGLEGYKDCITAFAQSQQKISEQQQAAAQAAVSAANAAIKEYNSFVEQANKVTAPKDETAQDRADREGTKSVLPPRINKPPVTQQ